MNRILFLAGALLAGPYLRAAGAPLFQMTFQEVEPGKVPSEMLVLDGAFAVRAEGEARFLELPGAPLETFGVLFGPTLTNDVAVTARCFGTSSGRRYPAFAVGLGGVNGFKLRVSPGKKQLELLKGDSVIQGMPFQWESGRWTHLRLQIRRAGETWRVEGRAWTEGRPEPTEWQITREEPEAPRPGRASLWGAPYAGTPIRFDDLAISPAGSGS